MSSDDVEWETLKGNTIQYENPSRYSNDTGVHALLYQRMLQALSTIDLQYVISFKCKWLLPFSSVRAPMYRLLGVIHMEQVN